MTQTQPFFADVIAENVSGCSLLPTDKDDDDDDEGDEDGDDGGVDDEGAVREEAVIVVVGVQEEEKGELQCETIGSDLG